MSPREENLRLLAARHPPVHRALSEQGPGAGRVRIHATRSGHPTASVDGVYVHSRYDPPREAAAMVARETSDSSTALIVLGFGLGYAAEAARARLPRTPMLVVEPDASMFAAAVEARGLARLFSDPGVSFLVGAQPESLVPFLEKLPLASPAFLRLRPLIECSPGLYRAFEEVARSWILRSDINANTLARFGRLWVRNLARNLGAFLRCPGVKLLSGAFEGIPALILAGGPSLDDIIPFLPRLAERMLVVAVNTPLKACTEAGVEPDFTVVVDPQYWASRYLDWTSTTRGVLVAEPSTCPRAFRRPAPFFLCSSLFPLGESLEAAVGEKGPLGAGGSVATSAWDLARMLGASPLFAAGLDLGFPDMRTHCAGVYPEELWRATSDRRSPMEGSSWRSLRDIGLFRVRSASGGLTPTDRRMLLYKWWFENQLLMRPNVVARTLSPGSAAIEGMPLASLAEALGLPVLRPEIDLRMQRVRRMASDSTEAAQSAESADRLRSGIGALAIELEELRALSDRGLSLTRDLGAQLARGADARGCLREMDGVDQRILELSARNVAGFLIQSIIHGISGLGDRALPSAEVLERSAEMYAGIAESAGWQRDLLVRAAAGL